MGVLKELPIIILRKLLLHAIEMIDTNQCPRISDDDIIIISNILNPPKTLGREAAAKHLKVSLTEFHKLRNDHIIPDPRSVVGLKELQYYTLDLDKCLPLIQLRATNTR